MIKFGEGSAVWCKNSSGIFWPAKITTEPSSGTFQNGSSIYVEHFSGQGRPPKAKWVEMDEVASFEPGTSNVDNQVLQAAIEKATKCCTNKAGKAKVRITSKEISYYSNHLAVLF